MPDCPVMIFHIFHDNFTVSNIMVMGTPCHSSMPYARRSLVYSHFVTINRIMTVGFWKSQRITFLQFYFIHDPYLDYILCNIECIIIYPPLFMFVLLYSWCSRVAHVQYNAMTTVCIYDKQIILP